MGLIKLLFRVWNRKGKVGTKQCLFDAVAVTAELASPGRAVCLIPGQGRWHGAGCDGGSSRCGSGTEGGTLPLGMGWGEECHGERPQLWPEGSGVGHLVQLRKGPPDPEIHADRRAVCCVPPWPGPQLPEAEPHPVLSTGLATVGDSVGFSETTDSFPAGPLT